MPHVVIDVPARWLARTLTTVFLVAVLALAAIWRLAGPWWATAAAVSAALLLFVVVRFVRAWLR